MALPVLGLIAALAAGCGKMFLMVTAAVVAIKVIMKTLIAVVLPIVMYNVASKIIGEMMNLAQTSVDGSGLSGVMIQFSGMGGWMAQELQLPLCMSILTGALCARWGLGFLRK